MQNLQSTVNQLWENVTQIIHWNHWEKRTFKNIISSSIIQGEFTKMRTTDGRMIMVNTKNVFLIEVFNQEIYEKRNPKQDNRTNAGRP